MTRPTTFPIIRLSPHPIWEREFIQRLNQLSRALGAFTETYKGGEIDLKKVKALRKAMHELEKSPWFRPQKEAGT